MNWFLALVGSAVMFSAGLLFGATLAMLGAKNDRLDAMAREITAINEARQQGFASGYATGEQVVQSRILAAQRLAAQDGEAS